MLKTTVSSDKVFQPALPLGQASCATLEPTLPPRSKHCNGS